MVINTYYVLPIYNSHLIVRNSVLVHIFESKMYIQIKWFTLLCSTCTT